MHRSPFRLVCCLLAAGLGLVSAAQAQAPRLTFTPFHPNGIYALGDQVGWNVTLAGGAKPPRGIFTYTIKSNNLDLVKTGTFRLVDGKASFSTAFQAPAMLYVTVDFKAAPPAASGPPIGDFRQMNDSLKALLLKTDPSLQAFFQRYPNYMLLRPPFPGFGSFAEDRIATLGAAVDPTGLRPSVPAPADFDAFWAAQLKALRALPVNPQLQPTPTTQPGVKLDTVTLNSLGSHVHGYLARPDRPGKYPALIIYQYAGVYALNPTTATNRAAEGWLTLDVDSHDLAPTQGTGVPSNYQAIGDHNRDTSYFLDMYLRDTRALDYIRSRPDWDGKTVVLMGTSMGGQQSLVTAGLNPGHVSAVIVNVPSGADSNGNLHGRRAGYPFWNSEDPQVMKTALYFDTVNFARHITAPTLAAMGFIDTTAPPVGIWTALDQIPGQKEAVPMINSDHNNRTPQMEGAFYQRSEEVLANLLHGGAFIPNPGTAQPQK